MNVVIRGTDVPMHKGISRLEKIWNTHEKCLCEKSKCMKEVNTLPASEQGGRDTTAVSSWGTTLY
jgi:hypothetical protein